MLAPLHYKEDLFDEFLGVGVFPSINNSYEVHNKSSQF
jgi:hypothetical protein